jgi:hypothetical protein
MSTTAKIASKGTKGTGITEELASTLHDNLGKTIVAVVEITAETRSENRKGDETVGLSIGTIEVAPDGMAADHVRELARSFHYERKLADGTADQTLPMPGDSPEPQVSEVLAAGKALEPHDFDPIPGDEDHCDICGNAENDIRHDAQVRKDYEATADDTGASDEPPEPDEE